MTTKRSPLVENMYRYADAGDGGPAYSDILRQAAGRIEKLERILDLKRKDAAMLRGKAPLGLSQSGRFCRACMAPEIDGVVTHAAECAYAPPTAGASYSVSVTKGPAADPNAKPVAMCPSNFGPAAEYRDLPATRGQVEEAVMRVWSDLAMGLMGMRVPPQRTEAAVRRALGLES